MKSEDLKTCRCGSCGGSLGSSRVNLVATRLRAEWDYPAAGNLITGDGPCAVGVACDECVESGRTLREVIEWRDGRPLYHDVGPLQDLGPEPTFVLNESSRGKSIECLVCGAESFHPEDILQQYCARCRRFHPIA